MFAMRAMAAPAPSVPTSIEAGDITLSVSVTARWEFVERR
jgi:uncharacterized protein YggE